MYDLKQWFIKSLGTSKKQTYLNFKKKYPKFLSQPFFPSTMPWILKLTVFLGGRPYPNLGHDLHQQDPAQALWQGGGAVWAQWGGSQEGEYHTI